MLTTSYHINLSYYNLTYPLIYDFILIDNRVVFAPGNINTPGFGCLLPLEVYNLKCLWPYWSQKFINFRFNVHTTAIQNIKRSPACFKIVAQNGLQNI